MTTNAALARNPSAWNAPLPPFFNPKNASQWGYRSDFATVSAEAHSWRKFQGVKPAPSDSKKVHLLMIDVQKDFCFPTGTLYVGGRSGKGAMEDSARTAEFIYRNLNSITRISATLDTHSTFQIFFPSFWEKADGSPVEPHTMIMAADLDKGMYRVSAQAAAAIGVPYVWLTKYARHYCATLETPDPVTGRSKNVLYIWPYHCMLGTEGHAMVGVVQEAAAFHALARGAQFHLEVKGGNPITENYSVLSPEVLVDHQGHARAQKNVAFIETLIESDRVVLLGQAKSHCVAATADDFLREIVAKDPALAQKVYVVEDCMSSVAVPDGNGGFVADFTQQGDDALKRYAAAGMHIVRSTDPIDLWPNF